MSVTRRLGVIAVAVLVLAGAALEASAQITTGTITGTVKDSQGGVIPGALVSLTNEAQGTEAAPAFTDRTGTYTFPNIAAGTYTIPDSSALGPVGRGWQIGAVYTALTGRTDTANISNRDQSGQDTGSMRADCLAAPIYDFTNADAFITNKALAFGTPAAGRLGTCGRNSFRGPGLAQWDLNLLKAFHLSTGVRLEARWEIFNLFNTVNLGNFPTTNVRSGAFAIVRSTPDVDAGNPVIAQGGPRAMQWAVKFLF